MDSTYSAAVTAACLSVYVRVGGGERNESRRIEDRREERRQREH